MLYQIFVSLTLLKIVNFKFGENANSINIL